MGAEQSRSAALGEVDAALCSVRANMLDMKNVAQLTWTDFVTAMAQLNIRCRQLQDGNGKYLLFALKKGTSDSILWKATVRICCLKVSPRADGSLYVQSRRTMNLPQFLRSVACIKSMIDQSDGMRRHASDDDIVDVEHPASSMTASTIMNTMCPSPTEEAQPTELDSECIVCMERRPDVVLRCAHAYCRPCIEQWKEQRFGEERACPICRARIGNSNSFTNAEDDQDDWVVVNDRPEPQQLNEYLLTMASDASSPS